ncbi:MFS transporter, DHA2 family, methylenomycin A resistance protein [Actinacidiphila yanglinensis]|uniref:MFS transporter, DHA2 family, methylenomycin A resistance protein n=1 Tax=Actinacidiphila yanglinensis TaxID=310779 RepID=A0A1H6CL70_9ACTN|nr:MFS transporter [Actinacidiphila yanglinensis]SEG73720.1 MFS transporter, DHA2 family, methylenomycin A resistance protein [Actinacidiphila yanglinensis]
MNTELTAAPGRAAPPASPRARWTLTAASLGFLMVGLDATIVNVALPTLGREWGAGLTSLQWVVDGYTLMFAALQLIGGTLSDRLGARRAYGCGLALFVLASLACGLAASPGMLVAARFVQGVGAAVQLPASLAMVRHAYAAPAARARAVGVWAASGGAAVAAGPVLGGLLLERFEWRSLFLVNLLFGAVALVATARAYAPPPGTRRRLDLPGQAAVTLALSGLTFGLIEGGTLGWTAAPVLAALAVAVAGGAGFAGWERRAPEPMLPPRLFADPVVSAVGVAGFAQNFAYYGIVFLLSLFLQEERGHSALATGLAFLPMSAAAMLANVYGGRLAARLGPRLPLVGGQLLFAAGLLALLAAGPSASVRSICLATVPVGLGGGAAVPAMTGAILDAVPSDYAGTASAHLNTARQVGGAVGVALFGALVASHFLPGLRLSLVLAAAALMVGAAVTARHTGR